MTMATTTDTDGAAAEAHKSPLRLRVEQEHVLVQLLSLAAVTFSSPSALTFPLHHVTKLDLPNCKLSGLPECLPEALPNLSILFLSNNSFKTMPLVVGKCPNLQMVAFKGNGMEAIEPEAMQRQLRWLILTDNRLTELPPTIGRCTKLQKLMLSGNQLTRLPREMANCTALELVRLASNQLVEPPTEILQHLPKLAWVGLSSNPFLPSTEADADNTLPVWDDVPDNQGEILGRGAAGVVRKVRARDQWVAVKEFASSMTSDGLAQHERHISCLLRDVAESSSALVRVLGETRSGSLVLEYLDGYASLASPPSLESCSRDVYDKNVYMSEEQAVDVVSILLSTLFELHRRGICHGDFYSHNLLMNANDYRQILLSDLGAAFQYDASAPYGKIIERTELRAFLVFLQELIDHVLLMNRSSPSDCEATDYGDEEEKEEDAAPLTQGTEASSSLLTELRTKCQEALDANEGFEAPVVWWKQQRLRNLATWLDEELDLRQV
jgi:Protein kinase domain/Leucine rich repeat